MKTIKLSAVMIFMLILSIAFSACGGDSSDNTEDSGPKVYAGGYCEDENSQNHAGYWLNGKWVELKNSYGDYDSYVNEIAVNGNKIYAAGDCYYNSYNYKAGYWENGTWHELANGEGGVDSYAVTIVINGSNVYVGGQCRTAGDNDVAGYWEPDGTWVQLINITTKSFISSLVVDGTDIYAGGYYVNTSGTQIIPCYWKNGTRVDLANSEDTSTSSQAMVSSVIVDGGNVYSGGKSFNASKIEVAGYWTNDSSWTGFTNSENSSAAAGVNSLVTDGSNIYAGGFSRKSSDIYIPGYWTSNGTDITWTALTNNYTSTNTAKVSSLYLDGNYLYAAGYCNTDTDLSKAGYWEPDGTWVECANTYGEYDAAANSIVVVTE